MAKRRSSRLVSVRPAASALRPRPVVRNLLLASLPPEEQDRLSRDLQVIPLTLKEYLYKPGEPTNYVYFPGGGFCSLVTVLRDGGMVEVATIGREGMVGADATRDGGRLSSSAVMVQGETDTCYRMAARIFRREMDRHGALYEIATRYTQALMGTIMQSTACNAVHSVEERLARWLLMARDRMASDEFPLTQEFVAMMLGATRPTVSVVAGALQRAGLITYRRGRVKILDRKKLELASCECYKTATALLAAALTRPAPQQR
jgi:CRP-like cAMP-binding protein